MEVRKMRQGEESAAYSLVCSSLDEYFAPEVISYFMMQWPSGQLVAVDMFGRVIGYLAGSKLPNGRAAISLFCVDASFRGKGIGTMMFNQFRQIVLMNGFSGIQLEVKESNRSAFEFYRRKGFNATERLDNFYNDGSAGIRMVLDNGGTTIRFNRMS